MNKIVNIYSLSGKDPFLAFTTLSLFSVILEESNIKKKTQKLKQKNPNQLTLYRQARNKEEGRDDFKISIGFYNLLAASVFLTIWVHMKYASLSHLYVYEVKKIGTCTHRITS